MVRTLVSQTPEKVGEEVLLKGWVSRRRDHGKLVFVDLRDRTGIVQVVGENLLGDLRGEDVIQIVGLVKARPEAMVNKKIPTGEVEIEAKEIKTISKANPMPFPIDTDGLEIDEDIRLRFRYLDLRRERAQHNLRMRHQVIKHIRDYLDKKDFVEIETPILTKATPEGARDFLVPSRLQPGSFYALPQSPQQYKQLLMVAGFEKYYQIARCFRDEDPRADRAYGEFTQLDLEMSFPTQNEILSLIEDLYKSIVKELFPHKKPTFQDFPRLNYSEVMEKYGTDKPDLRENKNDPDELAFLFIVNFPLFEWKKNENRWDAMHHPFTAPREEDIPDLMEGKNIGKLISCQHDFVLNGIEIGGGSIRITDPDIQRKIFEILGHTKEEIENKFGHLLEAFTYGVPPHGGIAPGIDRFLKIILNQPSLREVIAFPMSSSGQTAVMDAPSSADPNQLEELGIKVIEKKRK
ncbi:MAG: aspartate--tRNA ligase [bacterium]|nr:aspartate--tRNA ligase [bacterium]